MQEVNKKNHKEQLKHLIYQTKKKNLLNGKTNISNNFQLLKYWWSLYFKAMYLFYIGPQNSSNLARENIALSNWFQISEILSSCTLPKSEEIQGGLNLHSSGKEWNGDYKKGIFCFILI